MQQTAAGAPLRANGELTMPVRAPDAPPAPKYLLTTAEACNALGIKTSKLKMLVVAGKLERVKLGSLTRYRPRDLERYADSLSEPPPKRLTGAAAKAVAAK